MTIHRRAAARDPNEAEIVAALRKVGALVWYLSAKGIPDLLVGHRGRFVMLEVKRPPGPRGGTKGIHAVLTEAQEKFFHDAELGELPAYVVRNVGDALRAIGVEVVR